MRKLFHPNSNTRLQKDFFEYNCEKNYILLWGEVAKCSLERLHSFLMKFTLNMNSCFIQHNAPPNEYPIATQQIYSFRKELFIFSQFQLHFNVFDVCIVSLTVNYNIQLIHISLETYAYFLPTTVYCPF